ncbi:hypothetical protein SY88_01305 [Clostridiales bacterium PH28_bin88]|nr:hypothetical protein SY88_01305 [Clostridiales bacterium PH28_bin88]
MASGKFITIEGPDGSGKSTQARLLAEYLGKRNRSIVLTREPGGTFLAEKIRGILLDPDTGGMAPEAEVLLYAAARAQHVAEIIRPALAAGKWVISDRFVDSSIAYQGYGRGLDPAMIWEVNRLATGGLVPDLTVVLDIDAEEGLSRITRQRETTGGRAVFDRMEQEETDFHRRVREGYLDLAKQFPHRVKVVSALGQPDAISRQVSGLVEQLHHQKV